ncbi:right-handed parallel beta-helix repeat-containing protein [Cerasicoccus fimbriatus]|uniref:right-handed parallel beta-helix repeat-containing protein n=1 Tax=Cerasicoccus fimbriatus TaxID=3014554 RepID=UPI0022B3ECE6|nr:right-handed parallel beta-helix repeat-containing protein [Cerasicoccus sp. TK19100]
MNSASSYRAGSRLMFGLLALLGSCFIAGCGDRQNGSAADQSGASETPSQSATIESAKAPVATQILYVSNDGDDAATGAKDAPLATIQAAIDRVKAGGEIRVQPGVYRERLVISEGGTVEQPIRIVGEAGAVIDGSVPVDVKWEEAADIGPGVWLTRMPFDPRCVTVDGQFFTLLNQQRVTAKSGAKPEWQWTTIFREGINAKGRGATWDGINGLGFYLTDGDRFYVRLKDQANPAEATFTFSPNEPAVKVSGASYVEISGFEIRNTPLGVGVVNASHVVVDGCRIGPTRDGVRFGHGSRDCTVRYCEIFQNPYSNYLPKENSWETWTAHKRGGWYDMRGVMIDQTLGGHEIHDNHIHDQWDGISSTGWDHWRSTAEERMGWTQYNQNLNIHHNLIEDMNDDSLEPNSAEINGQWHDNLVLRSRCALRVKVIDVGPLYLYRNLFADNREDIRFYGELELNPAEVYIYHNTSTARTAIMSNKVRGIGTPNYHVYNNLFYAGRWWGNTGESVDPNWTGDYNVFVRQPDSSSWDASKALAEKLSMDVHSRWVEDDQLPFVSLEPLDLALTEQSPARGAGIDLKSVFGRDLPGFEADIANPALRPDAGALPYGQPMPTIPRPRAGE